MSLPTLDDLYGPVIAPQGGVRDWERSDGKMVRRNLGEETATYLKELIEIASKNPLAVAILQNVTILWAVDAAGNIFFAVEERAGSANLNRTLSGVSA